MGLAKLEYSSESEVQNLLTSTVIHLERDGKEKVRIHLLRSSAHEKVILSDTQRYNVLVGVLDTIIQVANGVEGHVGEILLVDVVGKTSAELDGELALHVCQLISSLKRGHRAK